MSGSDTFPGLTPSPFCCFAPRKEQKVTNPLPSQALSESEARGRILRYTVTFEALDPRSPRAGEAHTTTQTSYARVMPRVGYRITVTAENSRGRSPPASIVTTLGTQGKGFSWVWTTGSKTRALLGAAPGHRAWSA